MINFRSRVEYVGDDVPIPATAYLKGYRGIVTSELQPLEEDTYVQVTFMNNGATVTVNILNLREIIHP